MTDSEWSGWPVLAEHNMIADLPVFKGHFPSHPVVPGALLLDWACRALGADLPAKIREMRFLRPCGPGSRLRLRAATTRKASSFVITTEVAGIEIVVAKGSLSTIFSPEVA